MLQTLITSQTRIKLLIRFFINPNNLGYLRGLADEFGESSNAIRVELNRFESAGLLVSMIDGNKKIYQANSDHPLFPEIQSLVLKYVGIDKLRENVTDNYKNIEEVWITGNYNFMNDNDNTNLLLVGEKVPSASRLQGSFRFAVRTELALVKWGS